MLQNDPYQGNNHLPDFIMAKPIFAEDRIVAYAAVRGHWVDIGGSGPGSYSVLMNDIYGEGLIVPPVKVFREGELNEDVLAILMANTRNSRERLGDLRSQYAGCVAGERRVLSLCDKYGPDVVQRAMEGILDRSELLTRAAIKEVPDGTYTFEDACDGIRPGDTLIRIAVAVTVDGDSIHVDFSGSSPQVRGGMNAPVAVTLSSTAYAIKCLTDPQNPPNSGCYRPVSVFAPPGTVVNPNPPAPVVAGNHETATRIMEVVVGALAPAIPDRVCAAGAGGAQDLILGAFLEHASEPDREVVLAEAHGGAHGGHAKGDGLNGRRVGVGNTGNTPNEVMESTFPMTVLEYGLTQDAGGPGMHRGGTGITRTVRLEHDAVLTITAERALTRPYGLFGGLPGKSAHFSITLPDGTTEAVHSKAGPLYLPAGTVVRFQAPGGGGYGSPSERSLLAIQEDLDDEYVTAEQARQSYGVTVTDVTSRAEGRWVASASTGHFIPAGSLDA